MQILYYILLLAAVYIVLIAAPAIVMYCVVFSRKNNTSPDMKTPTRSYYEPYQEEIRAAAAFLNALAPQELYVTGADGTRLRGLYFDGGFTRTAILMHGYRANPMECLAVIGKELYAHRFNLLLPDQRAHGGSGGKHSLLGIGEQDDLLAWIEWTQSNSKENRLLLYGMSMGSAAIGYASERLNSKQVGAMVIDCGFSSPYAQLQGDCKKWHLPGKLLLPLLACCAKLLLHIDLHRKLGDSLSRTTVPALFLHGTADRTVCVEQGRENFLRCASKKEWLPIADADHTVAFLKSNPAEREKLFQFIEASLQKDEDET